MKALVCFNPTELDPALLGGAAVVVIDVVRATTTMVEALANGARAIYPTSSAEEAVKLASSLGREDTLLCGERKGVKVEGFHLGNSPSEFGPDVGGCPFAGTRQTVRHTGVRSGPRDRERRRHHRGRGRTPDVLHGQDELAGLRALHQHGRPAERVVHRAVPHRRQPGRERARSKRRRARS